MVVQAGDLFVQPHFRRPPHRSMKILRKKIEKVLDKTAFVGYTK